MISCYVQQNIPSLDYVIFIQTCSVKLKERARASNLKLQSSDCKNVFHIFKHTKEAITQLYVYMIVTLTPEKSIGTILNKS